MTILFSNFRFAKRRKFEFGKKLLKNQKNWKEELKLRKQVLLWLKRNLSKKKKKEKEKT